MENNETVGIENYTGLLKQISALLNLSLSAVKKKHTDYSHCLIESSENEIKEKAIEIRLDEGEITITCIFNAEEVCNRVFLFPDNDGTVEEFVAYLKETFDYDFIKGRWIMSDHYIGIREVSQAPNDICFMIYG